MDRRLIAFAAPESPMFVTALDEALRGGPAVLPIPPGPATATQTLLDALRPHAIVDAQGCRHPLPNPAACADEVVAVVATSGSTGAPKAVELSDRCLRASAQATAAAVGSGAWLACLPRHYVAGLLVLVRSLLAGKEPIPGDLQTRGAAFTAVVPTMLQRALANGIDLTHFRAVLVGGAAAPPRLLDDARRAGVRVITTYGMTETSGGCVYDGTPLPGVTVTLEEDGRVVIQGPQVARGYRGGEIFTEGRFRTEDLGEFGPDGRLKIIGRVDDVIITGGNKVHPQPVEALLSDHPRVGAVLIVGVPNEEWGQSVVAVVVPRVRHDPPTLDELRHHVRQRAPAWMAPRDLRLVEDLPRLESGKVDRRGVASTLDNVINGTPR